MNYDFRDEEPVWVRYAEWVGGSSDKYYETRVDMGDDGLFYLTKRWGRRPDNGGGQTKVENYSAMVSAIAAADDQLASKLRKGYTLTERPTRASARVAQDWQD